MTDSRRSFLKKMKKAPKEAEPEEEEKKDPRGPRCFECSGFGHIRADCCENFKYSQVHESFCNIALYKCESIPQGIELRKLISIQTNPILT
jgi:hypothetical protein